jgi:hypothetical protein
MTERMQQAIDATFQGLMDSLLAIEPVTYPVPPMLLAGLERYRSQRIPTGDFLRAVLENNLKEAVGRADIHSQAALCAITSWCYNNLPSEAWGSPKKVDAWLAGS